MLDRLTQLVTTVNSRVLGQVVMSKANHPLGQWLVENTAFLPESATVKERIHCMLTGNRPVCKQGNTRKFYTADGEYKFCNSIDKCPCFKEYYDSHRVPLSKDAIATICEKRKETWKSKYGVDNPSKNAAISEKRRQTMQSRSYSELRSRLKQDLQTQGYHDVVERVRDSVLPRFSIDDYNGCSSKNVYEWTCCSCGSLVVDHVDNGRVPRCLTCNPRIVSKAEIAVRDYCESLGFTVIANTKDQLKDREYDIFIPEKQVAIEFNGVYWHSSKWKDRFYHVDKFIRSRDIGVRLIQIFEDEWITKQSIVKARLQNILGVSERIPARKCTIKAISTADYQQFCNEHHLQGYAHASIKYALYHNDTVVAVMGFGKSRYSNQYYELIRYCSRHTVIGGASRLFAHFVAQHDPTSIVSYANRCWSDGGLYTVLGFLNVTDNDRNVGYWYVKQNLRYHRSSFTKARLVQLGYDSSKTEEQIMQEQGYHKLYDCGNYKFEWTKPN